MPKINVYLPDELAAAVKDAQLPVSAVCQAALESAVREVTSLREQGPIPYRPGEQGAVVLDLASTRYTNRARRAIALAQEAASTLGHTYVGTEHVLLGILEEGSNLAVKVLEALDVVPDDLQAELRGHIRPGDGSSAPGQAPRTPNATSALELAMAEAVKLGHNYIGCEHLLLGLIAEPEGMAGSVLRQLGLELRVTRRAVTTALSGFLHGREATPPTPPDGTMAEVLRRLAAIEAKLAG